MAKYFYAHLFSNNPGVRSLFPADMSEQRDRLFAALTAVVQRLDDPALPEYLRALGRDHRKFAAEAAHYAAVGESLIAALRFGCPSTWDAETEEAWLGAYKVLAEAMLGGAEEAEREEAPRWWECRVVAHRPRGRGIAALTLRPEQEFPYRAGQFASVTAPQAPQVWRPYSFANAPRSDDTLDLHVSRIDGGLLSPVLVDGVREGDTVRLGPATGTMVLPERTGAATFMAAGTGWAPVRALVEEQVRRRPPVATRVFVVARATEEFYDVDALRQLEQDHPWLNIQLLPAPERLAAAVAAYAGWERQDVFVSGPPGFSDYAAGLLADRGVPAERVVHDNVPRPQAPERKPGHAQWFLNRPRPRWINPADR